MKNKFFYIATLLLLEVVSLNSLNASSKQDKAKFDRGLDIEERAAARRDTAINMVTGRSDNRDSERDHVRQLREIEREFRALDEREASDRDAERRSRRS